MNRQADKLRAYWSKREHDVMFNWPAVPGGSSDGHWLNVCLERLVKEAGDRGLDLSSLRVSIGYTEAGLRRRRGEVDPA